MSDHREGAKGPGPCGYCNKVVPSTLTSVTLSICEGLEEVENVLVRICDKCGNMISIPAKSNPPIQRAYKKLTERGVESDRVITTELKSIVDTRKSASRNTVRSCPQEYPLVASAG